ncbi:MAG: PilZ domain-containing protein [Parvularcula sp.]|jgi:hypothetical protein|nr:PilZ domain-containing protein [Parvularcula sp.]
MTIAALLQPYEVEDRRTEPRYRVRLPVTPADLGHETLRIAIHEVSATGLMLQSETDLHHGAVLILELPGTERKIARVVWAGGRFYGVKFRRPLTSNELQKLRNASDVVWPEVEEPQHAYGSVPRTDLEEALEADREDIADDEKLILPQRLGIIFGSTAVLWAVIFGGLWLLAG